jgi:hypothetical protein
MSIVVFGLLASNVGNVGLEDLKSTLGVIAVPSAAYS